MDTNPNSTKRTDHVFNDDLLTNSGDADFAKSQFPDAFPFLNFPRLQNVFLEYDKKALHAAQHVRKLGLLTVTLATAALLTIATKDIWPKSSLSTWIALIFELGGAAGSLGAAGAIWIGPWRSEWLEYRLMAERVRQWHFQMLIMRLPRMVEASGPVASEMDAFNVDRNQWFESFLNSYEGRLDSQLESLTNESDTPACWLHPKIGLLELQNFPVVSKLMDAMYSLRLEHQLAYTAHKLRINRKASLWRFLAWPILHQLYLLERGAAVCFASAMAASLILIYCYAGTAFSDLGWSLWTCPSTSFIAAVRIGAVVAAIGGLFLRTVKQGLALELEVERFRRYRRKLSELNKEYSVANSIAEKQNIFMHVEEAAFEEMREFLQTHQKASFLLD